MSVGNCSFLYKSIINNKQLKMCFKSLEDRPSNEVQLGETCIMINN